MKGWGGRFPLLALCRKNSVYRPAPILHVVGELTNVLIACKIYVFVIVLRNTRGPRTLGQSLVYMYLPSWNVWWMYTYKYNI